MSAPKKPRFSLRNPSALAVSPPASPTDNDPLLSLDPITSTDLPTKRNAVRLDGYDSDSSNEGFDARADAKAAAKSKAEADAPDEEEDMFADLEERDDDEDEAAGGASSKKNKSVRFLEADEIEGQVQGSVAGGHVSSDFSLNGAKRKARDDEDEDESESESERVPADPEEIDPELGAGGLKTHAPKLDAFNMSSEMEEGRFDEAGNFVRKAVDPSGVHDSWLEGVSKKDMKRAREAADRREEERRGRMRDEDGVVVSEVLAGMIRGLEKGETVLEALARLGAGAKPKRKWQTKSKNRRRGGDEEMGEAEGRLDEEGEKQRRESVEQLTEAADRLLSRGQTDVYDASRELLVRWYGRETGEEWVEPADEVEAEEAKTETGLQWEYRWVDARDGGVVNGPFDGTMMTAWSDAGFFAEGGVEFRRVGTGDGEWRTEVGFT